MDDLAGFQRDMLYIIADADQPSGQDVKDELERYYDSGIDRGRLYPNLDIITNKGLITKSEIDRRTNCYQLSEAGVRAIRECHEWQSRRLS